VVDRIKRRFYHKRIIVGYCSSEKERRKPKQWQKSSKLEGKFGPHVQSIVIRLYYAANMSEPKIIELLSHLGISISEGQLSNILTKQNGV
jgi:hypothetical protein